jgi:uncharacterized alpha-E superfamily protein
MARYLERAASLARVIEMQSSFGAQQDHDAGWASILALYNDEERFRERHEATAANIIAFYVSDAQNPGSMRSSIHMARENARAMRAFIPLEMWVQINDFYTAVQEIGDDDLALAGLPRTCARIGTGCLAQIGIVEGTLYRDEAYLFFKLGLLIERADQTSRLLDVKFAQANTGSFTHDPSHEFVFWTTILRTAAAYRVFQRLEPGTPDPERVARFLILNPSHPRTVGFCVREIGEALQMLRGPFRLPAASAAQESCEVLMEGLQAAASDANLSGHLHAFNDWVQRSLISLCGQIENAFFPRAVPTSKQARGARKKPASSGTQEQSQK